MIYQVMGGPGREVMGLIPFGGLRFFFFVSSSCNVDRFISLHFINELKIHHLYPLIKTLVSVCSPSQFSTPLLRSKIPFITCLVISW